LFDSSFLLVTTACLVAVLLPYLVGLDLSRGVQDDAEAAVRFGADLYVSGEQFGRPAGPWSTCCGRPTARGRRSSSPPTTRA
jgi:hypothetical protein